MTPISDPIARSVSLREKLALGLGIAVRDGSHNCLHILISPVFNIVLGLSPAYLSVVVFLQRLWDAFTDPIVGQFSDQLETRWGRRRPLMLVGLPILAIFFALIWWVPSGWSDAAVFGWLLATSLIFYVGHSLFAVPLGALQAEASQDYHERTRIVAVATAVGAVLVIGTQWIFPLAQSRWFADTVSGVRWVTLATAGALVVAGLVPILMLRERGVARTGDKPLPFFASLRQASENRDFARLLGMRLIAAFGHFVVQMLGMYLNFYLVHGGAIKDAAQVQAWIGSGFFLGTMTAVVIFSRLARLAGKKRALQWACAVMLLGGVVKAVVYQPGLIWWQAFVPFLNGFALGGINLITASMLPDLIDVDELTTHRRREGLYVSVLAWADKVGNSAGTLVSGFLLVAIGFDAKLGGAQSATTLTFMKWSYVAFPFLGGLAAILLLRNYAIDQARAEAVRAELAQRMSSGND